MRKLLLILFTCMITLNLAAQTTKSKFDVLLGANILNKGLTLNDKPRMGLMAGFSVEDRFMFNVQYNRDSRLYNRKDRFDDTLLFTSNIEYKIKILSLGINYIFGSPVRKLRPIGGLSISTWKFSYLWESNYNNIIGYRTYNDYAIYPSVNIGADYKINPHLKLTFLNSIIMPNVNSGVIMVGSNDFIETLPNRFIGSLALKYTLAKTEIKAKSKTNRKFEIR